MLATCRVWINADILNHKKNSSPQGENPNFVIETVN